jgi:trk system potassium uptake protein TrkA
MKVVVCGGGAVGKTICRDLLKLGNYDITVVDFETHEMQRNPIQGVTWVSGDGCDPDILRLAGAEEADVYVCATGDDQANLVSSLLAKTEFGVPKTIARINHPKNAFLFDESWGVDFAISMPEAMTTLIEEAVSVDQLIPVLKFTTSGTSLFKFKVSKNSAFDGMTKDEFMSENPGVTLCAVVHENSVTPPQEDIVLESGDELILLGINE